MSLLQTSRRRTDPGEAIPVVGVDRIRTADAMTFSVLRLLEDRGGLTGIEVSNQVKPIIRLLLGPDIAHPTLPLLHSLQDRGLLVASADQPPRYQISEAGADEAARLAVRFWPIVAARIARIDARVSLLFAREAQPSAARWPSNGQRIAEYDAV